MARKANQTDPANAGDPKVSDGAASGGQGQSQASQSFAEASEHMASASQPADRQSAAGEPGRSGATASGQSTAEKDKQPAGRASGRGTSSSDLLKEILEGFLKTSSLQTDYQTLYRSLPAVVGIAAEIMKKKEAGDTALDEGMQAVERVLGDARDKAEQLSKAMMAQQAALDQLLNNKATLTDLLKASQKQASEKLKELPHIGIEAAALADPKIAYQLNTLMGNINSMVSREVERQLSGLRAKAASAHQQANPQK